MTHSIFLSIDYDEFQPGTYRAVTVSGPEDKPDATWSTGDVVRDWTHATGLARRRVQETGRPCMFMSSCDHFVMDDPAYRWTENEMIEKVSA